MTISVKGAVGSLAVEKALKKMRDGRIFDGLERYGALGVEALRAATPVESGATASAWRYEVKKTRTSWNLSWYNDNENQGANIAILLQYGHGTGTGGYVPGTDFVNPAIRPVFEAIASEVSRMIALA